MLGWTREGGQASAAAVAAPSSPPPLLLLLLSLLWGWWTAHVHALPRRGPPAVTPVSAPDKGRTAWQKQQWNASPRRLLMRSAEGERAHI